MIARIEGNLLEKTPTRVVIDVAGVGYELLVPLSTFAALPDEGKTVALRVHTHVRQEAFVLYGFATAQEKAVFELLLHASRVGPKLAQTILSGVESGELIEAIRSGQVVVLRSAPGVGAKMAERIVVELRDRAAELEIEHASPRRPRVEPLETGARQQLVSALVNLQTPKAKAERVADEVVGNQGEDAPIEELVRSALRRLAR
ncbi:MAG: Holliday junction branch migration protein RuvA [Deltaproteobacteria bacterium]|nr:Holliday junction branch migration protein RuvA [Deltaproteobacteria bacterium]MBW2395119.1 Holliday junction branch migration protein RuvA [Deltaproteobacteria bacterium]